MGDKIEINWYNDEEPVIVTLKNGWKIGNLNRGYLQIFDDKTVEKINALGKLLSQMGKRPKKEKDVMYDEEKKSGYVTEDGNKKTGDLERGDESSVKPVE